MATYMRQELFTLDEAAGIHLRAEALLAGNEYDIPTMAVLRWPS